MAKRVKPEQIQAEGDALSEVEDLVAIFDEVEVKTDPAPAEESKDPAPAEEAKEPAPGEPGSPIQTMTHWAQQHGHIAKRGPIRFPGDIHRGPDLRVVLVDAKLAQNSLVTEADYLAAVERAYGHAVR